MNGAAVRERTEQAHDLRTSAAWQRPACPEVNAAESWSRQEEAWPMSSHTDGTACTRHATRRVG